MGKGVEINFTVQYNHKLQSVQQECSAKEVVCQAGEHQLIPARTSMYTMQNFLHTHNLKHNGDTLQFVVIVQ